MSDNVLSYGFMAVLQTPIPKDLRDEVSEVLLSKSNLEVNYEGTIVYSDDGGSSDITGVQFFDSGSFNMFVTELSRMKVKVQNSIKAYSSVWYNGSDSYMSSLKLENY